MRIFKYVFLILLTVSFCNGATSSLLKQGEDDSNIVDIGYKFPKSDYQNFIAKELKSFDPLIQEEFGFFNVKARELSEEYDCEIDYLGRENCPVQTNQCIGVGEYDRGYSVKNEKTNFTNKIKIAVERSEALDPNTIEGDYKLPPTGGKVNGSRFNLVYDHSSSGRSLPDPHVLYENGYQLNGKFAMKLFSFGSGCGGLSVIPISTTVEKLIDGGSTVSNIGYRSNCQQTISSGNGKYAVALLVWDTIPDSLIYHCDDYCLMGKPDDDSFGFYTYACPTNYIDSDGIISADGMCKKKYTYYTYKCYDDKNTYDLPWIGPTLDSGTDCDGVCGGYECECNSNTPPAGNCVRETFECPTDPNQLCNITTGSHESAVEATVLVEGLSSLTTGKVEKGKICPGYKTWDPVSDTCESSYTISCLEENFILNEETGKCEIYCEGANCNCSGILSPLSNGTLLEENGGTCIVSETPLCEAGYAYDASSNSCLQSVVCEKGTYSLITNKCEYAPTCEDGYSYNSDSDLCEKLVTQNKSTKLEFLTKNIDYSCPDGFALGAVDGDVNECQKQVTAEDNCYSDFAYNASTNKCEEKNYTEEGEGDLDCVQMRLDSYPSGYTLIGSYEDWILDQDYMNKCGEKYDSSIPMVSMDLYDDYVNDGYLLIFDLSLQSDSNPQADPLLYVGTFAKVISSCPEGYIDTGTNCEKQIVIDPKCSSATFENVNESYDKCVADKVETKSCPVGYTSYDENQCAKTVEYCANGYVDMGDDHCTKILVNSPECYNGVLGENDMCGISPMCSNPGDILDASTGKCKAEYLYPVCESDSICQMNQEPICEEGYVYNESKDICEADGFCTNGYKVEGSKCVKEYEYYKYECPDNAEGPLVSSEYDCLGDCGDYGCVCGNATPPSDNCKQTISSINGEESKIYTNVFDGHIYDNGNSSVTKKTIQKNKTCEDGKTLNTETGKCESETEIQCSAYGFTLNEEATECTRYCQDDPTNPCRDTGPNRQCSPLACSTCEGEVVKIPEGSLVDENGETCIVADIPTCLSGYTYDNDSGSCVDLPICFAGVYDEDLKKCVLNVECPTEFTYNSNTKQCESPIQTSALECPNPTDIFNDVEGGEDTCSTMPILTDPIYIGEVQGSWWHCDSCYSSGYNVFMKQAFLPVVEATGGTYAKAIGEYDDRYGRIYMIEHDAKSTFYLNFNNGSWMAINPGDIIKWSYKRITNLTTNQYRTGGGKPWIYTKVDITCDNWVTVPATKDYPSHQACADDLSEYASCPDDYLLGADDEGHDICYKDPICPVGYEPSSNGQYCITVPVCDTGYTVDYENNECIRDDINGNMLNEVTGFYEANTVCGTGSFFPEVDACVYEPNCNVGSVFDPSLGKCSLDPTYEVCENDSICIMDPVVFCKVGSIYNEQLQVCESEGYCNDGYMIDGKVCSKEYSFSTYTCPSDQEGPLITEGNDCLGSCGNYGCSCNEDTPPANNCRKPIDINEDIISTVTNKRDLNIHHATGSFNSGENGVYKGFSCGDDCDFLVKRIIGKNNELCFESESGRSSCIRVDGCGFAGTIENLTSPNYIKELSVTDSNTLSLGSENGAPYVQTTGFECPGDMIYNTSLKICTSDVQNFYNWEPITNGGNGNWVVQDGGNHVEQLKNASNPTFFLSPDEFPNSVILEGEIWTTDDDDDFMGMVFDYKDINNYRAIIWAKDKNSNQAWHRDGKLVYRVFKDGVDSIYESSFEQGWERNVSAVMKIVFNEKIMQVYVDGAMLLEHEHEDGEIDTESLGRMGFYNYSQSKVNYKNFFVQSKVICDEDYTWEEQSRSCVAETDPIDTTSLNSTCMMNGHVGWPDRTQGIMSVTVDPDIPYRLNFWDSYLDKNLGFIEFPPTVSEENRKEKFITEKRFPYEMNKEGFTAIDYIGSSTFYVYEGEMSPEECNLYAVENGLNYSESYPSDYHEELKTLTGNRYSDYESTPKCLNGHYDFGMQACIVYEQLDSQLLQEVGDFIWDPTGADNISSSVPFYAPVAGHYQISLKTKGSLNFYVNDSIRAILRNIPEGTEGNFNPNSFDSERTIAVYLNSGTNVFKVEASKDIEDLDYTGESVEGEKGFSITVRDTGMNVTFSSLQWNFGYSVDECSDPNMIDNGNICLIQGVAYCLETGAQYNTDTGMCEVPPKCIVSNALDNSFSGQENAIRVDSSTDENRAYICSPLVCEDHTCQTADCPTTDDGIEFLGTTFMPGETPLDDDCTDQSCDANLPYYQYCAIEKGCNTNDTLTFEDDEGDCYSLYCPENQMMNMNTFKCEEYMCPEGTVENANGECLEQ